MTLIEEMGLAISAACQIERPFGEFTPEAQAALSVVCGRLRTDKELAAAVETLALDRGYLRALADFLEKDNG